MARHMDIIMARQNSVQFYLYLDIIMTREFSIIYPWYIPLLGSKGSILIQLDEQWFYYKISHQNLFEMIKISVP